MSARKLHLWLTVALVAVVATWSGSSARAGGKNRVRAVTHIEAGATTTVRLKGAATPTFTVYKLERPTRVVVDVAGAELDAALGDGERSVTWTASTWAVSQIAAQDLDGGGVRVVVTMARPGRYDVKADGNDVVVVVTARDAPPVGGDGKAEAARAAAEAARAEALKQQAAAQAEADAARKALAEAEAALAAAKQARAADQVSAAKQVELARAEADRSRQTAAKAKADADGAVAAAAAEAAKARKASEAARADADQTRKAAAVEAERLKQEAARTAADARDSVKAARTEADAARKAADVDKRAAEAARTEAAQLVAKAKANLAAVEAARSDAETTQRKATEARKLAEAREAAARDAEARVAADRKAAEAALADAEAQKKSAAGAADAKARKLREDAETAARDAEQRLAVAEGARVEAERRRHAAEDAATSAKREEQQARTALTGVEQRRGEAERARTAAEIAQRDAEARRADAESRRAAAEAARKAAEDRQRTAEAAATEAATRATKAKGLRIAEEAAADKAAAARVAAEQRRTEAEAAAADLERSIVAARVAASVEQRARDAAAAARKSAADAEARKASDKEIAAAKAEATRRERERAAATEDLTARRKDVDRHQDEVARLDEARQQAAGEVDRLRGAADTAKAAREREEQQLAAVIARRAVEERELEKARAARVAAEDAADKARTLADADAAKSRTAADLDAAKAREAAAAEVAKARGAADAEIAKARQAAAAEVAAARRAADAEAAKARQAAAAADKAEAARAAAEAEIAKARTAAADARTAAADATQAKAAAEADAARARKDREAATADAAKARRDREAADAEAAKARAAARRDNLAAAPADAPKPAAKPDANVEIKDVALSHDDGVTKVVIATASPVEAAIVRGDHGRAEIVLAGVSIPKKLERTLDARKLGGPVRSVSAYADRKKPGVVRVVVDAAEGTEPALERVGNAWQVRFTRGSVAKATKKPHSANMPSPVVGGYGASSQPVAQKSVAQVAGGARRKVYRGPTVDLDVNNADIHNLLRLLSQVGNVNIVVPDEIKANVTVRLQKVPWDQALEVILSSKGLWYRREGNLYRIAPRKTLDAEDQAESERQRALVQSESPEAEVFTLNYADAGASKPKLEALLSPKGKIEVDDRTNSLIINDIRSHRRRIIDLASRLDTQTPQISIEARIVEARSTFAREIGVQWGGSASASADGGNATGLVFPSSVALAGGADDRSTIATGVALPSDFAVNLPAAVGTGSGGAIGLSLGSVGGNFNLNLRLSALEDAGTVRIISAPKITVVNHAQAEISQGVSIPISVVSAQGTQTQFVPADLSLKVTPFVSQRDCSIAMDIEVTKNEPDFVNTGARGDPTILRKEAKTRILIADGETTVMGGIYTRNTGLSYSKVPFFGDLPVLGWFFKTRKENDDRTEVLVFITPKITNKAFLRCE